MRDYQFELDKRIEWIRSVLAQSGCRGVVFGNSGGKDCALVGILCKKACEDFKISGFKGKDFSGEVLGVLMPCSSKQNYTTDTDHALLLAKQFDIKCVTVDLTQTREVFLAQVNSTVAITTQAKNNINPRLRMTTLYAIAQSLNYLVVGTGNKSELYMGYFTKWGDGGCDFNPIADLTATEIFEFLNFLKAPIEIIEKAPSAGLFDGQTDEMEMGVSYASIDKYIQTGEGETSDIMLIQKAHKATEHKRNLPKMHK